MASFDTFAWQSFTLFCLTRHSLACLDTYMSLNSKGFMMSSIFFDFYWVQETNLSTLLVFLLKHSSMDPVNLSLIKGSILPSKSPFSFMTAYITSLILESMFEDENGKDLVLTYLKIIIVRYKIRTLDIVRFFQIDFKL